ncbi:tail assembly chaperone [Merdimonas faecis]
MMELTINGQVYQFNFGMGFLRDANKTVSEKINNATDKKKDVGATYMIAGIMDGDPEDLVNALDLANKGQNPRVTRALLDSYIEDPNTDIDQLFEDTLDFLERANATRKLVERLKKRIEEAKAKAEQNQN